MTTSNYDEALRRILVHEGGYSNHPSDPGGPTNFGITINDYRKYVKPNATAADMRAMKLNEAKAIYRRQYADPMRFDDLPSGVDYSVLDYGINSGIGRSGRVLRRVVGLPDTTHVVTDDVLRAVARRDSKALVIAINDERLRFLKNLRTWPVFGAGWGRRVAEVRVFSLELAERPSSRQAHVLRPWRPRRRRASCRSRRACRTPRPPQLSQQVARRQQRCTTPGTTPGPSWPWSAALS
jgi:lysozyme family protein